MERLMEILQLAKLSRIWKIIILSYNDRKPRKKGNEFSHFNLPVVWTCKNECKIEFLLEITVILGATLVNSCSWIFWKLKYSKTFHTFYLDTFSCLWYKFALKEFEKIVNSRHACRIVKSENCESIPWRLRNYCRKTHCFDTPPLEMGSSVVSLSIR